MDPSWNFEWRTVAIGIVASALMTTASLFIWDRFVLEPRFHELEKSIALVNYYVRPIAKRYGVTIPQQKRPQQKK